MEIINDVIGIIIFIIDFYEETKWGVKPEAVDQKLSSFYTMLFILMACALVCYKFWIWDYS